MGADSTFERMDRELRAAISKFPFTPEAQSAAISLCIAHAATLAEQAPAAVREHWAQHLREVSGTLAQRLN